MAEELPPTIHYKYALVQHAEPCPPRRKYVQLREFLRRQSMLAGGIGLEVAAGSMQAVGYLGERGVYPLRLWEVLVLLRDWHTGRVVQLSVASTAG